MILSKASERFLELRMKSKTDVIVPKTFLKAGRSQAAEIERLSLCEKQRVCELRAAVFLYNCSQTIELARYCCGSIVPLTPACVQAESEIVRL